MKSSPNVGDLQTGKGILSGEHNVFVRFGRSKINVLIIFSFTLWDSLGILQCVRAI